MTDDIIDAAKQAALSFHSRLAELYTSEQLRQFVDDYFHTLDRKEFWWNVAWYYDIGGVELWSGDMGDSLKKLFTKEAYIEWNKEKLEFRDPRAQLGFKLGSPANR